MWPWRKTMLTTVLCFLLVAMKVQARHYHLLLCQLLNGLSSFLSAWSLFCGQLLSFFNLQSLWRICFQHGMSSTVTLLLESQVSLSFFLFSPWVWREFKAKNVFCFAGGIFLVFTAPLLIIAFLAIAHLNLTGEDQLQGYVISQNVSIFFITMTWF